MSGSAMTNADKKQIVKELEDIAQKRGKTISEYLEPFEKYAPDYTAKLKEMLGIRAEETEEKQHQHQAL